MLNLTLQEKQTTTGLLRDQMVVNCKVSALGRFILGRCNKYTAKEQQEMLDHLDQALTELQDSLEKAVSRG